jgi:hypothetical protein
VYAEASAVTTEIDIVVDHNANFVGKKIDNAKLLDPFDVDVIDGCKRRNYFANAFHNSDIVVAVVVVVVGK